jgi:hypothetical protein
LRSVRSLGPLIKTRAFGMTPGRRFPNYFKPTDYPLAVVGFEVGEVCADYQDYAFRNLNSKRLQFDEMWSWIYCKDRNRAEEIARKCPDLATFGFGSASMRIANWCLRGGSDSVT